ncbi:MAG: CRISPR-associated helicase Cas3' [Acidobacteriota bacterium]|jgi:CRISPR-associated endonuclease/helicase Cas3
MEFGEFFRQATTHDPYPYQKELATADAMPELLDIPTGLGKTAGAILAWLWRRRFAGKEIQAQTPRRLVYCLPMRVLVEQTHACAVSWLDNLGLLGGRRGEAPDRPYDPWFGDDDPEKIRVHMLMGGDVDRDWDMYPERDAILIGTQDMLLSRALNRGYAMSRFRWPVQFGLLNNDCLWIFDEVQIMGSGLATTAQLDAFRKKLWPPYRTSRSLWMSATLGANILRTREREDLNLPDPNRLRLSDYDHAQPAVKQRLDAPKSVLLLKGQPKSTTKNGLGMLDLHSPGRISLIVLNTVKDARAVFEDLKETIGRSTSTRKVRVAFPDLVLLHSRYRPIDRTGKFDRIERFISKQDKKTGIVSGHPGMILVSTQVVEAGFDLSGARLWSEIAPWASLIQRLGRLNREGMQPEASAKFWMPKSDLKGENDGKAPNSKRVGPYDKDKLESGRKLIEQVVDRIMEGESYRDALDAVCESAAGREALAFEPEVVIRPPDLFGLFSTEPDLAGGFTNVFHFVRDQDRNVDVQVFWREVATNENPLDDEPVPRREELCSVPFYELRKFLGNKGYAWEWNFEKGRWEKRRAADVHAGMTLMLAQFRGGYSDEIGWTGDPADKPTLRGMEDSGDFPGAEAMPPESLFEELSTQTDWVTLPSHLADVERVTGDIASALGISGKPEAIALATAARWHDRGKSLDRWQHALSKYVATVQEKVQRILSDPKQSCLHEIACQVAKRLHPPGEDSRLWAKFPDISWAWTDRRISKQVRELSSAALKTSFRPWLRHEAASALAAWDNWISGQPELTALAIYLIASHHGKVRTVLRSIDRGDEVFGLNTGESLPVLPGYFSEVTKLSFTARLIGSAGTWDSEGSSFTPATPSWVAVVSDLLGQTGDDSPQEMNAVREGEPCCLGPFGLAYLEALLRAADSRASKWPGKEAKR